MSDAFRAASELQMRIEEFLRDPIDSRKKAILHAASLLQELATIELSDLNEEWTDEDDE